MKTNVDHADLLKVITRHKAKTLHSLEDINCPEGYLDIIRKRFDYYRNDLIALLINE